eukprot:2239632-Amphidinium_carterae.1
MSAASKAAKEQGICFDWLKGKCKRGDQWKYKHEKPTLPAAPSPSPRQRSKTICKFYLKGTCNKGSDCPFSHEKPRKSSRDGRKRTPERRGSRDRKGSGGRNQGSDRKRSGSGGQARQRKTSQDKGGRNRKDAAPVTLRCHSSDDDTSSVDPEDINEVNHWSDEDDEFQEPYEVAAVRHKDMKVTFSLQPEILTHEVENIIMGRTKLLKKKSRARVGTQSPSKADSRESVREARQRAKAMRAEVISEEGDNDEYGAFSIQPRKWLMDTGSAFDLADKRFSTPDPKFTLQKPLILNTANGLTEASKRLEVAKQVLQRQQMSGLRFVNGSVATMPTLRKLSCALAANTAATMSGA